jgi:hypothetical protein
MVLGWRVVAGRKLSETTEFYPPSCPGLTRPSTFFASQESKTWMPGSSPGMTGCCAGILFRKHTSAFPRPNAPEVFISFRTSFKKRAQGMPDARCTRDLMRNVHEECAHEHTGQRRTSDIPCAMVLRLITSSPRRTALLPPLRPEKQLPPGALTPAPRRQDHTSLPYALAPFAIGTTSVHRNPSHVRERS